MLSSVSRQRNSSKSWRHNWKYLLSTGRLCKASDQLWRYKWYYCYIQFKGWFWQGIRSEVLAVAAGTCPKVQVEVEYQQLGIFGRVRKVVLPWVDGHLCVTSLAEELGDMHDYTLVDARWSGVVLYRGWVLQDLRHAQPLTAMVCKALIPQDPFIWCLVPCCNMRCAHWDDWAFSNSQMLKIRSLVEDDGFWTILTLAPVTMLNELEHTWKRADMRNRTGSWIIFWCCWEIHS